MDASVIADFFGFVDTDHDGFITIDELKNACAIDIDGDGVITEYEKYQCARVWITEKLPLQDLNGDQKLTLEELLAYNGI